MTILTLIKKAAGSRVYLAVATALLKQRMVTAEQLPEDLNSLYRMVFDSALTTSSNRSAVAQETQRLLLVLLEAREPLTMRELQLLGLDRLRSQLPLWNNMWFER